MLSLFKSKRNKWRDEAKKQFQIYIDSLKGMDADELGSLLDIAKKLKDSMLQKVDPKDTYTHLVFSEPLKLSEELSLTYLDTLHKQIISMAGAKREIAVGAFFLWWLSLAAATFAELRFQGREMWRELERGFQHCMSFDPDDDLPKGLEPLPKN